MKQKIRLPIKSLIALGFLLFISNFLPENLYSQTNPVPPATTTPKQIQESSEPTFVNPVPPPQHSPITPAYAPRSVSTSAKKAPLMTEEQKQHQAAEEAFNKIQRPSLINQGILLALLSLLPFIIMILTSFLKVVVVLSLLRTALGVQQAPPNQIINGVAFLISLFIMYPTAIKMYDAAQSAVHETTTPESMFAPGSANYVIAAADAAAQPLKDFLQRNSSSRHQTLFYRLVYRGLPEKYRETLKPTDVIILVPSYITGQLKDAFEIGVLIYIPFFVIDLVTSNILLAMGMMMLSPVTISMPLKLFLLVMLDGWTILIEGLVKTFI